MSTPRNQAIQKLRDYLRKAIKTSIERGGAYADDWEMRDAVLRRVAALPDASPNLFSPDHHLRPYSPQEIVLVTAALQLAPSRAAELDGLASNEAHLSRFPWKILPEIEQARLQAQVNGILFTVRQEKQQRAETAQEQDKLEKLRQRIAARKAAEAAALISEGQAPAAAAEPGAEDKTARFQAELREAQADLAGRNTKARTRAEAEMQEIHSKVERGAKTLVKTEIKAEPETARIRAGKAEETRAGAASRAEKTHSKEKNAAKTRPEAEKRARAKEEKIRARTAKAEAARLKAEALAEDERLAAEAARVAREEAIERQGEAVERARKRFQKLQGYDEKEAQRIALGLLQDLAAVTPSIAGAGWKAKALEEAAEHKASSQTMQRLLTGDIGLYPEKFSIQGAADALAKNLLADSPGIQQEAAHYLTRVPWTEKDLSGHRLMEFARTHALDLKTLLTLKRREQRMSPEAFAGKLGLKHYELHNLMYSKCARVLKGRDIVAIAADGLGITEAQDRADFAKLAHGSSRDITQATLDGCFAKDSAYHVDPQATGQARTVALSRFYELLVRRDGLRDFKELAGRIAGDAPHMAEQLFRLMHNTGYRATLNGSDHTSLAEHTIKVLAEEPARRIAAYAFPGDAERQQAAFDFLHSRRELHYENVSDVRRRAWQTYRQRRSSPPEPRERG